MAIKDKNTLSKPGYETQKREWEPVKAGMYQAVIESIEAVQTRPYTKPGETPSDELLDQFKVLFRILTPGAAYGRLIPRWVSQSISNGEVGKESILHEIIKNALNGGETLTREQVRAYYEDATLLNRLEGAQVLIVVTVVKGKNKIVSYAPAEAQLPPYEPPVDPRSEKLDDPSVVCTVTGKRIRGWEMRRGDRAGEWVTAQEWAEKQREILGDEEFAFDDFPGQTFRPPFSPKYYQLAKAQKKGEPVF